MLLLVNEAIGVSLVNDDSHLLDGGVLNDVSAFTVEDLACKKTPEHLKNEIRVLLGFVDENLFKTEQELFRL
jgi:hypothetical protein